MPKDIVDYLNEKHLLEAQINELKNRNNLLEGQKIILEEMNYRLGHVNKMINKFSGKGYK